MNKDLSDFYKRIDRQINIVAAYLQNKNYTFIIKSCRWKPINNFTPKYKNKLILEKIWVDEFGNSLIFEKQNAKIILDDPEIKKLKIISTDLFAGRSLIEILEISKLLCLVIGEEVKLIALLGRDNFLRIFQMSEGEIKKIAPAELGLDLLLEIATMKDVRGWLELRKQFETRSFCSKKVLISSLPIKEDFPISLFEVKNKK